MRILHEMSFNIPLPQIPVPLTALVTQSLSSMDSKNVDAHLLQAKMVPDTTGKLKVQESVKLENTVKHLNPALWWCRQDKPGPWVEH